MIFSAIIFVLGFMVLGNQMGFNTNSDHLAAAIVIVFSLVYITQVLADKEHLGDVRYPLVLGYLFRIALMLWNLYGKSIYMLPYNGKDSEAYYHGSVWHSQGIETTYGGMFSIVMGWLYSLCGTTSRLFGQFVIVLFSVATMHVTVAIIDELGIDKKNRKIGMSILCLLPVLAILCSVFTRESIITMFISISLYCFVLWIKRKNEVYFLLAFAFVFCASSFHGGTAAMAIGYIIVKMIYNNREEKLKITPSGIIVTTVLLFVMVFLFNNYGGELFGKVQGVEDISDIANESIKGGSSYAAYVGDSSTPLNMVIYTIPRIVYFLFSPFPWQWRGLGDIIAFCFSAMFYAASLVRAIRYLLKGNQKNRRIIIVLLILAACMVFVFGWGVANTGTATRHRDKVIALYVVLYILSAPEEQPSRTEG